MSRTTDSERVRARYWIETAYATADAAAVMAGEQSSGTFVALPGETPELLERAAARVEWIEALEPVNAPSLPGAGRPSADTSVWNRAIVELSWPLENIGTSLPNLLATVAGNLFELKQFSGLKLVDLDVPKAFCERYPGPAYGVAGTRRLTGVEGRPLIGTIVKPSVGLTPAATAALVRELADAGLDFIKDDELQANGPSCPLEERVAAVMRVLNAHAERSGKMVMYAFNITGDIDEMLRGHDLVLKAGGNCVMVSLNSVGLAGFSALRRHAQLPIHAHRNGWGYLNRSPALGFDYVAWQKFWRLAGADHMHVNGLRNKFCESDDSVIRSARACLTPMYPPPTPGCQVMPVFASGQTAAQAADTYRALGSVDLIYACGGGVMGHPDGIGAGVESLRLAWEAAVRGVSLDEHAGRHAVLRRALQRFAG
ncbi:MAG: ribulose-bisphosphate carboxylase large subunit family protein [Burkholderiales bacterium]|nr:ribulose-bisphosphate carboxylase large subunit family protein [Burkholderiales bacterium]